MGFNRFRIQVIMRIILLGITVSCLYYFASHDYVVTAGFFLVLFLGLIYNLIYYVEKTNRDLARFINSIKFSDFSQSFVDKNHGPSFSELSLAFNKIIEQFQKARSETEEHFQYLQTVVKHVKIGLISFNQRGDIEFINDSAKELLKINELLNVRQLSSISNELVDVLNTAGKRKKSLLKLNINGIFHQISIAAAEFKMRGRNFTLVSLQDISNELEHARLSNELEIAREAQMRLLPKENPVIPGYSICSKCIPALEVGGDYYDFIDLGNGKFGIVIADVSGKGLPSAFYMTLTKGIFQSNAAQSCSPREVLIKLNSLLYRIIDKKSFITMYYAVLDYKNDKLIYARAGHEPVIYRPDNLSEIKLLKSDGIGLGLEKGELFEKTITEKEISLNPGDSLFFYTDGITDSKNGSNTDYGINSFINAIKECKSNSSEGMMNYLFEKIDLFRNNAPQYDDMTLIALSKNRKV